MIGKTISHYRILEKLGQGGMGEVYLAEDMLLARKVVLKFLPLQFAHDPDLRARFVREARVVATLNHPNIVTIYEVGEYQEMYYIVMEYVDGNSLRDLLGLGALSISRIIDIATQICAGLGAAHKAGVVHRDIKPANILMTTDGLVKIADFGLAKLQDEYATRLTLAGHVMGTPAYMSPEQIRAEDIDQRTDIFSLGIVLYEMITRQLPFKSDKTYSMQAVFYAIINEKPTPLSRYNPDIPNGLQKIIDKALEKNPNARYQLIEDLNSDLRQFDPLTITVKSPRIFEKSRKLFSFKRFFTFFSFKDKKAEEKHIFKKSSSPLSKDESITLIRPHKPISSQAEKLKEGTPVLEKPYKLIPSEAEKAKEGAPIIEKPHKPIPPEAEKAKEGAPTLEKPHEPIPPEAEKSSSSPPSVESEDRPSMDHPSLILKREHSILTNYANKRVIEDIILYEDFERLKSFITDSEGGRFVLTGYGRFGGTSLVKGAMNRAKRELKKRGRSEGDLLTFNFSIEESSEKTGKFEIDAIEFSFGTLSTQDESIKKLNLSTPLGNSFFGKPAQKNKSSNLEYNELIKQLKNFSAQDNDKNRLHEIVFELIGNESLPARVIIILDRVCHLETLESLAQVELFKNKKITVIAVARKEDFDRWMKYEQRLNKIGFKKWYVPCISLKETDFIQKISQVLLEPHLIQNSEAKDTLVHLRKHLEFVGKGILGEVLEELKHPQYWSSNKAGGFYLRLDTLAHQRNIKHNAWMQDVLSENWLEISGKLFPKDEQEDRARISCYHLVDWIVDHPIFTKEQLFETAFKVTITVSDNQEVLTEVVENLLQVLQAYRYLMLISENRYRVKWDNSTPPKHKKGPIKKFHPVASKTQIQSFPSLNEITSLKAANEQPIAEEAAKLSDFEKAKIAEVKNSDKSIITKRKVKIIEEEFAPIKESSSSNEGEDISTKTKILVVFANPKGSDRLRLDEEDRIIQTSIENSKNRENLYCKIRHAVRFEDLRRALLQDKDGYHIVQFSGHATELGYLLLEDETGKPKPIQPQALAGLLYEFKSIECVILNACYSSHPGQLISNGVPFTIAMKGPISDDAAKYFIQGFYDAVGAGRNYRSAYDFGRNAIIAEGLSEEAIPQFLENKSK